ncbi:hypothetical protein A33Q_4183 [Indibacter alkaliphilus LW1]|uniref:Uncharacterized protein n=1 Tax=Indibacter alkaliphilus (strain CCUG 57479 / KCTC 22604 / LW1) TaxID=1189612 RepID=S2D4W8_INDAL|nr:hypothetical protein [Indibacter alkaliphilus]EOZ92090.1 hypothetical protein A33Q_4183 [Indibacter alkaliphilus LW1]
MKDYLFPVYLTTAFLIIFITAIFADINTGIVMFMFSISPAAVIWMVYKVLTADVEVNDTFEDKWYQDM